MYLAGYFTNSVVLGSIALTSVDDPDVFVPGAPLILIDAQG
jgi:hypothetical protein